MAKAGRAGRERSATASGSDRALAAAVDRLPVAFALFDSQRRLVAWNKHLAALNLFPTRLLERGSPLAGLLRFDPELKRERSGRRELKLPDGRTLGVSVSRIAPRHLLVTYEDATAARVAEERYDLAMRSINEGVYDWDIAKGTIYYSDRVQAATGMTPRVNRTPGDWRRRIHPDDLPEYDRRLVEHFKGKSERFECDYRFRALDGRWRWARQHGIALRDAGGRAVRMVGSTGDITELKNAETALREAHRETAEALERQTATAEILKVIASSPSDVQPVLEAVASSAARLCEAKDVIVLLREGEHLRYRVHHGEIATGAPVGELKPIGRDWSAGRCAAEGRQLHIRDILASADEFPEGARMGKHAGYRTVLMTPLLHDGDVLGVIGMRRAEVRPFDARQIELINTFADQAVIAIENVRLFRELAARNEELAESLRYQTASSEVLRIVSGSMSDSRPVFDAILACLLRLFTGFDASVWMVADGKVAPVVQGGKTASKTPSPSLPLDRSYVHALAILDRRTVRIDDVAASTEIGEELRTGMLSRGRRAVLMVPLMLQGKAIGALSVSRTEPTRFTDKQVALIENFASQAVIAIENARLFNETKEALERQTATAEILKVIASSPDDVQPVFDAISRSSLKLVGGFSVAVFRVIGSTMHLASLSSTSPEGDDALRRAFPMPVAEMRGLLKAFESGRPDVLVDIETEPDVTPLIRETARVRGWRSAIRVPLMRGREAIGLISVTRREPGSFSAHQIELLKTFADQAVIAIENVRLFNETKEALERQTATAEILRVISSTPGDTRPVFDAIVARAQRLIAAKSAVLLLRGETEFSVAGYAGPDIAALPEQVRVAPLDPEKNFPSRAILAAEIVHVPDWESDDVPEHERLVGKAFGIGSGLMVPLLREGEGIGALAVTRDRKGPFGEREIALLQSFADQAVIAIENVRLFNETKEALERQTASADVLAAMSGAMTDTQPVFDRIVRNVRHLFNTRFAVLQLLRGDMVEMAAVDGDSGFERLRERYPRPLDDTTVGGRAMLTKKPFQICPVRDNPATPPATVQFARDFGFDSLVFSPMIHGGRVVGAIGAARPEARPFDERQIALMKTFADQAVIAIENVRLFNETKEALERQTATADVLQVLSGSMHDPKPVFDKILERCEHLIEDAAGSSVQLVVDGDKIVTGHFRLSAAGRALFAAQTPVREMVQRMTERPPYPLADSGTDHAVRAGRALVYPDVLDGEGVPAHLRAAAQMLFGGKRSYAAVTVPLIKNGRGLGSITVARARLGGFSDKELSLLSTFADQAVVAIENARLFNETKEALERQTATAEILKVIAGSPSDSQPVFEAIAANAVRLSDAQCAVFRYDGELVHAVALSNVTPEAGEAIRKAYPQALDAGSATTRAIRDRAIVHIPDIRDDPKYAMGDLARSVNYRSILSVPMLRAGEPVGAITVTRVQPGGFPEQQIAMLKSFADQAVIAIENVRLFNETKEALERQTATAEILKVISSSPTDSQPVFDAIVAACARLFEGHQIGINLVDDEGRVHLRACEGPNRELLHRYFAERVATRQRTDLVLKRGVAHFPDIEADGVPAGVRDGCRLWGSRAIVYAPMVSKRRGIGAIWVARDRPGPFSAREIALLTTFSDQAVIAIENVRLFKELQERTEALSRSVEQLTALGEVGQAISSTLDLDTVLKTIVSRAVQLTGLDAGVIYEYDEASGQFELRATENLDEDSVAGFRQAAVRRGEGAVGTSVVSREPVQVPDIHDSGYPARLRGLLDRSGLRALLAVPLLREEQIVGSLLVARASAGAFPAETVDLLRTFASQSALAIQNARLFREIAEKGRQLEVASRHKSQFLASMSHELRTPLNAILGFNEMILGDVYGEVPEDMKEPLADMQSSGRHLLRLINNVLDLAKIEAGRMELALSDYSAHDIVENVRATLRPLAESKGLELGTSVPADLPLAFGDAGRLTQCLMNLAGNSLKFTKEGRVDIAVELNGDGLLVYRVADTGIGIPGDKIGSLFTEFKQTDATIASEYGGTGLGLSITRKFIEMHGGRIWAESEPGRGSTFIFEIPLRAAT